MRAFRLEQLAQACPPAFDARQARVGLERWLSAARDCGNGEIADQAERIIDCEAGRRIFPAIFGNSPFLTGIAEREPAFTLALLERGPAALIDEVMGHVAEATQAAIENRSPAAALRIAKRRIALASAVADIGEIWSVEQVTGALSAFAESALDCAATFLLADAARRGALTLANPQAPQEGSGLIVLGMGKLGAGELNYSSDIDLIIFYDPDCQPDVDPDEMPGVFNRLARGLVRLIADRTTDGYVFRTDLRLRPDAGATPPAISVLAAENYYETLGQNWERAAMIKARPVAGDRRAGAEFLDQLRPYIWRKNLDFAAIQDIHSIKRQINAHRGSGRIAVAGHNIKLGRGGIREIEFFVQTQQLIWGGRIPEIRVRGTVEALRALSRAGKITEETAGRLASDYALLRRIEHRLQMINDEQTHTLPSDPLKLAALATFLGYADVNAFSEALLVVLRSVENQYADLFEDAPSLSVDGGIGGNLVFTGGESDPETLKTLAGLGFRSPERVDAAVRGWHHGRCRAMRSVRARELLTELTPLLLEALATKPDPDAAFLAFDQFLNALPAGVQLFSMFHAHPDLLRLLTDILGVAPRLGEELSRRASLLDSVLSPDFFAPPPCVQALLAELSGMLAHVQFREERLDQSRRWASERRFQVGVQLIRGLIETPAATIAYSNVADVALRALLPCIEAEFAEQHGHVPGCEMAVVALGKLGSREMTATSDLDLILIYTTPAFDAVSDGQRPLPATQYFARLSQRLINAITAPTAEGKLYEVDMRLRPSGKAGPIATSLESFRRYQRDQAWTWEQMALTRARVIAGPPPLCAEIGAAIHGVLTRRRDGGTLLADVAEMRARMARERPSQSLWDVKPLRGGVIDIEFIVQYLQLRHAHDRPEILSPTTATALDRLAEAGLIDAPSAATLRQALALWQAVQGRLRLTLGEQVPSTRADADAPPVLRAALADLHGMDFEALTQRMRATAGEVAAIFRKLIEEPAADLNTVD